MKVLKESR